MTSIKDQFEINIRIKPELKEMLISWLFILLIPIASGYGLFQLIIGKAKIDGISLTFIIALILIAYIKIIKEFLLLLRGQEKITINNNELRIEKTGSFLDNPETYKLEMIETFSLTKKGFVYSFLKMHGRKVGAIQFEYYNRIIRFGQTLTQTEAEEIISRLNNQINNEPLTNDITNPGMRVR